ncbi:MAG: ADP-ribosylation factor-like protein [Candidatus Hodarchaeales archaeon]|jgi:small GTP-binding protein
MTAEKRHKICIIGLDGAGKTPLFQRLKTNRWVPNTTPTLGLKAETIQIDGVTFSVWDFGGHEHLRFIWERHTKTSKGLIFVIDLSTSTRFSESRSILWKMLNMAHLRNTPVAIFANKVDLADCSDKDLANFLGIQKMGRNLAIFKTSAKTGEGIQKGLKWLTAAIQESRFIYVVKNILYGRRKLVEPPWDDNLPYRLISIKKLPYEFKIKIKARNPFTAFNPFGGNRGNTIFYYVHNMKMAGMIEYNYDLDLSEIYAQLKKLEKIWNI